MGTLAGLSCVALALSSPARPWLLWGVLFLLGFGAVGWGGLMGTLAGETGGHAAAGAAAGVSAAFFNVGIFLGPPIFGFIVDRTGVLPAGLVDDGRLGGVALVLLLFVREGRGLSLSAARRGAPQPAESVLARLRRPTRARSPSGGRRPASRRRSASTNSFSKMFMVVRSSEPAKTATVRGRAGAQALKMSPR